MVHLRKDGETGALLKSTKGHLALTCGESVLCDFSALALNIGAGALETFVLENTERGSENSVRFFLRYNSTPATLTVYNDSAAILGEISTASGESETLLLEQEDGVSSTDSFTVAIGSEAAVPDWELYIACVPPNIECCELPNSGIAEVDEFFNFDPTIVPLTTGSSIYGVHLHYEDVYTDTFTYSVTYNSFDGLILNEYTINYTLTKYVRLEVDRRQVLNNSSWTCETKWIRAVVGKTAELNVTNVKESGLDSGIVYYDGPCSGPDCYFYASTEARYRNLDDYAVDGCDLAGANWYCDAHHQAIDSPPWWWLGIWNDLNFPQKTHLDPTFCEAPDFRTY